MKEEFKLKINADVTIIEVEVNIDLKKLINYVKEKLQSDYNKYRLEDNEFVILYKIISEYFYTYNYINDCVKKINKNDSSINPLDIEINDISFINLGQLIEEIKPYINI